MAGRKEAQTKEPKSAASAYEQASRKRQATSAKKAAPSKSPPAGRKRKTAAIQASQADLPGVVATGAVGVLGLEAKGEMISVDVPIPEEVVSAQQGQTVFPVETLRTELDAVEDLFAQIGRTITSLLALPVPEGDNQANAAVRDFEVFIRSGTLTVQAVRGQVQSADPNPVVVEQNVSAFQIVRVGVSWFREHFLAGMVRHIGATAAGHLLRQLDRQISELSHRLPEVIARIGHWAHLAGH